MKTVRKGGPDATTIIEDLGLDPELEKGLAESLSNWFKARKDRNRNERAFNLASRDLSDHFDEGDSRKGMLMNKMIELYG